MRPSPQYIVRPMPGQPQFIRGPPIMRPRPPPQMQQQQQNLPERRNTNTSFVAPQRRFRPEGNTMQQQHHQQQGPPLIIPSQLLGRSASLNNSPQYDPPGHHFQGRPSSRSSFEALDDSFYGFQNNNRSYTPVKNPTLTMNTLNDLVDQGHSLFSKHLYTDAITKWTEALELSLESHDLFTESKILSNIGCVLRIQGKHAQSLEYFDLAFDRSARYLVESQKTPGAASPWIYLVLQVIDVDESKYSSNTPAHLNEITRSSSVRSISSGVSSTSSTFQGSGGNPAFGPPIVVAIMDLASNTGNIHFCMGNFEESIKWHDQCIRLSEAVLEEFPLPIGHETPLQKANSLHAKSSRNKRVAKDVKMVVRLSYLHRTTILAQIRSYTHLSMCFLQMGQDDEASYYSKRAESLSKYFNDHSKSTPAPLRTSSISNTTIVIDQTRLYDAAVCANMGTVLFTMGRIPRALELHEHAAKLFNEIGDASALAKERGNLGCIWLEIGKALNSLHWISVIGGDGGGEDAVLNDESSSFWGGPRVEGFGAEDGVVCAGSKLLEKALIMVAGMLEKSKRLDDWMGVMTSCINLAVCYTVSQQPFMALFCLSRMLHLVEGTEDLLCVPPYFETQALFVLCQALFVLIRLQPCTDELLFTSDDHDSPNHPVAVNTLLRALGVDWIDIATITGEQLSHLLVMCSERLQQGMNRQSLIKPMLESNKLVLDSLKKKDLISKLTLGKLNWMMGSGIIGCTSANEAAFDSLDGDIRGSCTINGENWFSSASLGVVEIGGGSSGDEIGFINKMLGVGEVVERGESDLGEYYGGPVPGIFELAADLVGYSLWLAMRGKCESFDLLGSLRVYVEDGESFESIRQRLMRVAKKLYLEQLNFCEECLEATLAYSRDVSGSGLVPVSAKGAGAKFVKDPFSNGVICFGCSHFMQ